MKKILLVGPEVPSDVRAWWIPGGDVPAVDTPGTVMPLGLTTVAALTPDRYSVELWDECVHGKIDEAPKGTEDFDLIGITGYLPHFNRIKIIADHFKNRGIMVAIGGPGISAAPHLMKDHCDVMFVGESELTWPQFLEDWDNGVEQPVYRQIGKIDMATSPMPRIDMLKDVLHLYGHGAIQTTRGCPFDCEFCDVIFLYGRRQRHKPVEHVIEEIKQLQAVGVEHVFISDDEFIGNPKYAKELLRAMIPVNNSFPKPLKFRTQLTMNISKDDELLELIADANFDLLVIGVETPNKESLKETGKYQNIRKDLVGDIRKVLSYGIGIRPGIIVGFDHDGLDIFDIQYEFIQKSCMPLVSVNMLKAPIGTKLWTRMRQEGRMLDWNKMTKKTQQLNRSTNIIPKQMTRSELMRGTCKLQRKIFEWESFGERIRNMVSLVTREPKVYEDPMPVEELMTLGERLGVEPEGCEEIRKIFKHVAETAPFMWKKVRSFTGSLALYRRTLEPMLEAIEKQADMEENGEIKIEMDSVLIDVPALFRENYKKNIFPKAYHRAYLNLEDKSKLDQVLMEVFMDFLINSAGSLEDFTEYHIEKILQIVDRTCAKANGILPEEFVVNESTDEEVEKPLLFFGDEILKSVGQELVMIATTTPEDETDSDGLMSAERSAYV